MGIYPQHTDVDITETKWTNFSYIAENNRIFQNFSCSGRKSDALIHLMRDFDTKSLLKQWYIVTIKS